MAGSYNHVVVTQWDVDEGRAHPDDLGRLYPNPIVQSMLECNSGDVFECVEEMYGMIHYLAGILAVGGEPEDENPTREEWVEEARLHYKDGLRVAGVKPWDEA